MLASGKKELVFATLIIFLLVSLEIGYFIYKFVHIPIQKLNIATKKVAEGDFDYHIDIKSLDEIGELAGSFNTMTDHIRRSRDEIEQWNRELERRVEEATSQRRLLGYVRLVDLELGVGDALPLRQLVDVAQRESPIAALMRLYDASASLGRVVDDDGRTIGVVSQPVRRNALENR